MTDKRTSMTASSALEIAANIADDLDSGRGNEKHIAQAVREVARKGYWKSETSALTAPKPDRAVARSPDDIRAMGWSVAVHNDYFQNGQQYTFWLFTKDGQAIKGEGFTDADALNQVRAALSPTELHEEGRE